MTSSKWEQRSLKAEANAETPGCNKAMKKGMAPFKHHPNPTWHMGIQTTATPHIPLMEAASVWGNMTNTVTSVSLSMLVDLGRAYWLSCFLAQYGKAEGLEG